MGGGKDSVGGYDYNLELASPGTKNDSSEAEKGTINSMHSIHLPISQSNSFHFQAIGKM